MKGRAAKEADKAFEEKRVPRRMRHVAPELASIDVEELELGARVLVFRFMEPWLMWAIPMTREQVEETVNRLSGRTSGGVEIAGVADVAAVQAMLEGAPDGNGAGG